MVSLILRTATTYLLPLLLLLSVYLLFRGHNEPGGGFVGGLVASSAYSLHMIAFGVESARRILKVNPRKLIAFGLSIALGSAAVSWFSGFPFMTSLWLPQTLPIIGKAGTPFLFDVGVYFVVIGVTLTIFFTVAEE